MVKELNIIKKEINDMMVINRKFEGNEKYILDDDD